MLVRSLGQEDPLKKGMATHSSILAWRVPWTEEAGGLQSMGPHMIGHDWSDLAQHSYLSSYLLLYILNNNATTLHTSQEHYFHYILCTLGQWSPTFLVPGAGLVQDNFSMNWGWGAWFWDDSSFNCVLNELIVLQYSCLENPLDGGAW